MSNTTILGKTTVNIQFGCVKLLYDLKEARERLRQTSRNSSRPPSSDLPWDKAGSNDEDKHPQQGQDEFAGVDAHTLDNEAEHALRHWVILSSICHGTNRRRHENFGDSD